MSDLAIVAQQDFRPPVENFNLGPLDKGLRWSEIHRGDVLYWVNGDFAAPLHAILQKIKIAGFDLLDGEVWALRYRCVGECGAPLRGKFCRGRHTLLKYAMGSLRCRLSFYRTRKGAAQAGLAFMDKVAAKVNSESFARCSMRLVERRNALRQILEEERAPHH